MSTTGGRTQTTTHYYNNLRTQSSRVRGHRNCSNHVCDTDNLTNISWFSSLMGLFSPKVSNSHTPPSVRETFTIPVLTLSLLLHPIYITPLGLVLFDINNYQILDLVLFSIIKHLIYHHTKHTEDRHEVPSITPQCLPWRWLMTNGTELFSEWRLFKKHPDQSSEDDSVLWR